jgi:hypothetical protein
MALWAEWMSVFEPIVGERLAEINAGVPGGHIRVPVKFIGPIKDQLCKQVKLYIGETSCVIFRLTDNPLVIALPAARVDGSGANAHHERAVDSTRLAGGRVGA